MGGCCIGNCCVMDNFVGDFVRGVRDMFDDGGGCGYHPGPSKTEEHAKKIADELAAMKENVRESSEKIETMTLNWINKSMNELIQELEKVNRQSFGGKSLNINITGIRDKNEQLKKEVVGYIGNIMDDRLVLTDQELSVILEEYDDKKRAKNFDAFCQRIQNSALSGLSSKIESTVRKQEEMIRREIQARLNEVEKSMKEASKAYMEMVNAKEHDKEKLEDMRIKYIYKYELTEILLDQIEE